MIENILNIVLIFCGIVYIESQTFILERLSARLFNEKDIPVEIMPGFTGSTSADTEEIKTREKMDEEIKFMNEYIYKHVDKDNGIINIELEDDDYLPLIPNEIGR